MLFKDLIRTYLWWMYRPIKFFFKKKYNILEINRIKKESETCKSKIYYLGITEHSNLGDMGQHYCIKRWIEENYPNYSLIMIESSVITASSTTERFLKMFKSVYNVQNDRIVFQSGYCTQDLGGDHPLMHRIICENFSSAKILMMPQTIFFQNKDNQKKCSENHNSAKNMLFLARDFVSFAEAKKMFPDIRVIAYPDIVTTLIGTFSFNGYRSGVCLCLRNDSERYYSDDEIIKLSSLIESDGVSVLKKDTQGRKSYKTIRSNLQKYIENEIKSYSPYKVTITDRYHGTIFSLCAGTPVIIIKTTDHKVTTGADWFKGVYDDYVYVADNLSEAYNLYKAVYKKQLPYKLQPYFKKKYYDNLKKIFEE